LLIDTVNACDVTRWSVVLFFGRVSSLGFLRLLLWLCRRSDTERSRDPQRFNWGGRFIESLFYSEWGAMPPSVWRHRARPGLAARAWVLRCRGGWQPRRPPPVG